MQPARLMPGCRRTSRTGVWPLLSYSRMLARAQLPSLALGGQFTPQVSQHFVDIRSAMFSRQLEADRLVTPRYDREGQTGDQHTLTVKTLHQGSSPGRIPHHERHDRMRSGQRLQTGLLKPAPELLRPCLYGSQQTATLGRIDYLHGLHGRSSFARGDGVGVDVHGRSLAQEVGQSLRTGHVTTVDPEALAERADQDV